MEQTIIIASSAVGAAIICFGAAIAAGFGNSFLGSRALESMTRQPELADKILVNSLIYMGLIEAVPIIGIVIAIILVLANPFI
ncbi:MAG: F0F1 ATP synthase subunit C [Acidaminococcales bacterium]|nr:F0F1 ATP synthase subunit C [Acidaminococcales bacterium]